VGVSRGGEAGGEKRKRKRKAADGRGVTADGAGGG
jgi:hypothetical protein